MPNLDQLLTFSLIFAISFYKHQIFSAYIFQKILNQCHLQWMTLFGIWCFIWHWIFHHFSIIFISCGCTEQILISHGINFIKHEIFFIPRLIPHILAKMWSQYSQHRGNKIARISFVPVKKFVKINFYENSVKYNNLCKNYKSISRIF